MYVTWIRLIALLALLGAATTISAKELTIGVITDGPATWQLVSRVEMLREIQRLLGNEYEVSIPDTAVLDGSWSTTGAQTALDKLLKDREVDMIITAGVAP